MNVATAPQRPAARPGDGRDAGALRLVIDGRPVSARSGQTVLEAAKANGIYVPSLCHHPRVGQAGLCRTCVVQVEGSGTLQTACTLLARDGMVVTGASERVLEARRTNVELLLAAGTHDCLSCEAAGRCELAEAAYRLGVRRPSFAPPARRHPVDRSSQFIVRDPDACIRCFRCIRGCNDLVVNEVLDMGYRGGETRVICDADLPMGASSCLSCGECVQLCPTGALVEKKSIGKGRAWTLEKVRTTCPYCGTGCQVELHVDRAANRVVRVTGVEGVPPNDGMLCVKGRFAYDFTSSADRLTTPLLRRTKEAPLEPVTWNEALDTAADRLRGIRDRHGADAIGLIACARSTNEHNYAAMKFARAVIGTNNLDHCART